MRLVYLVSVYLHILAALLWLGGMIFLALVAVPSLRAMEDPVARSRLLAAVGRRFRVVGWAAIGVLAVTGVVNAVGRWGGAALLTGGFWQSEPGQLLALKLGAVAVMLTLSAVHDFVLGPRLTALAQRAPGGPASVALRRRTVSLARAEVLLGLVVVALAVLIVRGLP
jgi:uncharacterized membrane protein